MQRIILFLIAIFTTGYLFSQNAPVANNDYIEVGLGEIITINVVENDFHPDSLSFEIFMAAGAVSFTDSTITYNINYEIYYNNYSTDTIIFAYGVIDENGNVGLESGANVFITIKDNNYYEFLNHNNIRAKVQASGIQFWKGPSQQYTDTAWVFEFPKGSGKNTIFN